MKIFDEHISTLNEYKKKELSVSVPNSLGYFSDSSNDNKSRTWAKECVKSK